VAAVWSLSLAAALAAGGSCGGSGKGSSSKAADDRGALSAEVQPAVPGDVADRRELLVFSNRAAARL
jgi:hypothetical protein